MSQEKKAADKERREQIALREILEAIQGIRHGTVTIFVQDGTVIQIDRTEKVRLDYSSEAVNKDGGGI